MLQANTPVEWYTEPKSGIGFYVKREDMACSAPGPPFAKVRGISAYLHKLKQQGVKAVGYMDTSVSMAGWGISYFAQHLGLKAVLFFPAYKDGPRGNQKEYLEKWYQFGAHVRPLEKPSMHSININVAKRRFYEEFPQGQWLPNGLRFMETIEGVSREAATAIAALQPSTIVICIGSGVMAAGVLRGAYAAAPNVYKPLVIGILAHHGTHPEKKKQEVLELAGMSDKNTLFDVPLQDAVAGLNVYKGGYDYHTPAKAHAPFPCNPYYDLKAYEYLGANIKHMQAPVLFWNIGA